MTLEGWALAKGLELSESKIRSFFESETDMQRLEQQAWQIVNKLDCLIQAPYGEAFWHLREGLLENELDDDELDKAKDCFIRAFSNDPLNVSAKLMYALILGKLKKYETAMETFWELFEDFSYRIDLIPEAFYNAFTTKMKNFQIKNNGSFEVLYGHNVDFEQFYVFDFWCSTNGLVISWNRRRKRFLFLADCNEFGISAFSWNGTSFLESKICSNVSIFGISTDHITEIAMVTQTYFVLRDDDKYNCFSFKDGTLVQSMNKDKFTSIFLPANRNIQSIELCQLLRFRDLKQAKIFENVYINTGKYTKPYIFRFITEILDAEYSGGTIKIEFK